MKDPARYSDLFYEKHLCYFMLKPDVVIRNLLGEILPYFKEQGLILLEFRCGQLSKEMYQKMYELDFNWNLDAWSINQKAYEFGPVIGLLYWDSLPGDSTGSPRFNTQEFWSQKKGAPLPEFSESNSLRWNFRASGRVFNLLHIPETPDQALLESKAWLGEKTVVQLLDRSPSDYRDNPTLSYEPHVVVQEIQQHGYSLSQQLSGELSFLLIKNRLFHLWEKQIEFDSYIQERILDLKVHYFKQAQNIVQHLESGCEYNSVRKPGKQEIQLLEQRHFKKIVEFISQEKWIPKTHRIQEDIQYLTQLNKESFHKLFNLDFFWFLLEKWGVFVSDLECYLVNTYFLYPTTALEPP